MIVILYIDCNLHVEFLQSSGAAVDVEMKGADDIETSTFKPISDRIYIVDHLFALNQYDFIENCDALSNFVLPDTVLRYLNRKNIQSFHGMKNLIE